MHAASIITLVASVALGAAAPPGEEVAAPAPAPRLAQIEDFAPPEEFVRVGAIKTHFVHEGESGRAVVLVHGFGSSTYSWRKAVEALSRRHRVYAFDLKGFGLTAKPKDRRYHMEAYSEHLLGFLDAMKLDRAVLVGHSLGGAVAPRVALLHPDRVEALVLEDPVPVVLPQDGDAQADALKRAGIDLKPKPAARGDANPDANGPRRRTAAEQAALLNPAIARAVLPTLLRATITRQTVENGLKLGYHDPKFVTPELVERVYRPLTIEGAAEALASMLDPPPPPKGPLPPLESLRLPTLVAWGAHDRVVPVALFERYAEAIPGALRCVFADSGHVPHEEEADAFNARVLAFLGSLPPN